MKAVRRLLLVALGFYLPVCGAQEGSFYFSGYQANSLSASQLTLATYKTRLLPQWSFDVEYDRDFPAQTLWVDAIDQHLPIDSVRLSASRELGFSSSQRVFASVQSSYEQNFTDSILYLQSNAGMAARLGWQLGDPHRLNMALEYEYREVGEFDVNSFVMGVHYAF